MWPFQSARPGGPTVDPDDDPTRDPFIQALNDAEELLKYIAEVGKDLTNHPVAEIERHLLG